MQYYTFTANLESTAPLLPIFHREEIASIHYLCSQLFLSEDVALSVDGHLNMAASPRQTRILPLDLAIQDYTQENLVKALLANSKITVTQENGEDVVDPERLLNLNAYIGVALYDSTMHTDELEPSAVIKAASEKAFSVFQTLNSSFSPTHLLREVTGLYNFITDPANGLIQVGCPYLLRSHLNLTNENSH